MLKKIGDGVPSTVQEEKEMSFLDHLEELRWHIIRSLIAIAIFAIAIYTFQKEVFQYVIFAPTSKDFLTYQFFCWISEQTCIGPPVFEIIPREMGEQFFTALKVSFWMGLICAFPYVFYQLWSFIKPGLYPQERKAARGVVWVCSFLFAIGVVFGYFVISPFAIKFLAGYSVGIQVSNSFSLSSYVGYMTMFTIPTGILFELPIVVFFLAKIGLITDQFMRTYRKHAFVIILVMSAIITPPDVITQFLISIPIFFLYEISILIAKRMTKKRERELL